MNLFGFSYVIIIRKVRAATSFSFVLVSIYVGARRYVLWLWVVDSRILQMEWSYLPAFKCAIQREKITSRENNVNDWIVPILKFIVSTLNTFKITPIFYFLFYLISLEICINNRLKWRLSVLVVPNVWKLSLERREETPVFAVCLNRVNASVQF